MNKLILASGSPRRKELLENLGIELKIIPPTFESRPLENEEPWKFVKRVSNEKLEEVYQKTDDNYNFILAADTIVVINNEIIGKPKDEKEWESLLKKLSGKWHKVYTGYALKCPKKRYNRVIKSKILFSTIDKRILRWYLSTYEGMDKAGGYAIQGKASVFIKEIRGSFSNIIGLPLTEVYNDLIKCSFFDSK
jgi:septum formation protein